MRKTFTTFGLFLITTFSFAQETKYVDTELLNVRSGAGTKYEVIDKHKNIWGKVFFYEYSKSFLN